MHVDLLATSVHVLNFLTLSSPYYVSSLLLASAANLFLTMHPTPVTLCVIGDLFKFCWPKSPSSGVLAHPQLHFSHAVRWSNYTVYSLRRSVGSRIEGSASQDFGWDGLTLHPNNLLSGVDSKASKPTIAFGACRHQNPNGVVPCLGYDPGMVQV